MQIKKEVERVLSAHENARNSDKALILHIMQGYGANLTKQQAEIIRDMPSFETITRIRRILQEQGKYPPSKEVEQHRYEKFVKYQDPETILESKGIKVLPWGS